MKLKVFILTALTFAVAESLPQNCEDAQFQAVRRFEDVKSGIFKIYPPNAKTKDGIEVFCDMETDGGGWIVIQRRENDSIDFFNDWETYVDGFGSLQRSLWLGLEVISRLTDADNYVLRVDLMNGEGQEWFAEYDYFHVSNASEQYKLTIDGYRGTAGDALVFHNGSKFTTKDRDNDEASYNCAQEWKGAWWYKDCYWANLNGLYNAADVNVGINWRQGAYPENKESLKRVEMKIRTSCYSKFIQRNAP